MKSLLLATVAITAALPAAAQNVQRPRDPHRADDLIVTAPIRQSEADVLQGTSVLSGEALTRELRPSIGETLARLPGVSATSFGPNASRPILRGFQGDRIRVLTDGIGSFDASSSSVDHAVAIDPLLAERIEVLRGPVALLYGSSAVGGVVNVIDARIPRRVPAEGYRIDAMAGYGSAADQRNVSGSVDVAIGPNFVVNANGSYLKTGDLRIGGRVLSRDARAAAIAAAAEQEEHGDHDHDHDHDHDYGETDFLAPTLLRGRLPNSAAETWTAGIGGTLVTEGGSLGIAYSRYDSLYGVPIRYATQEGQHVHASRIDLKQDRIDLRGEILTGGDVLQAIRVRLGHAEYRHDELEEDGEIGTTFRNQGTEGRLEIVQANRGGWSGASGVQYLGRDFSAVGEEAFLPPSETAQVGLFTLQQFDLGRFRAEGGVRYESTRLTARPVIDQPRYFAGERSFGTFSASLGASFELAPEIRVGLNGSRTERAPSAEELFSNGEHAGTQAYELGLPSARKEKSWGLEATFHAHRGAFSLDASAYHNWFSDFLYDTQVDPSVCVAAAGGEIDLPCFQYRQADARYWGLEADASLRLGQMGGHVITADVIGDYVRATVVDGGSVPRIPPLRLLGGLSAQGPRSTARVEVEHAFKQDRVAAFETATDGYTLVNASLAFRPWGDNDRRSILLAANNIFDVEARRHPSVLKDFAPLAGRDIRVTLRMGI